MPFARALINFKFRVPNDAQREKLCFTQLSTRIAAWLFLTFFIYLHNQLSSIYFIITFSRVQMLKNVIHQIDSKNEWLLLSASFTAKCWLVFVLTLENSFSYRFHFKTNRKNIGSFKNGIRGFQNSHPFERSACFYVTISGNFKCFQCFNFEKDFLENENPFQKTKVMFFS